MSGDYAELVADLRTGAVGADQIAIDAIEQLIAERDLWKYATGELIARAEELDQRLKEEQMHNAIHDEVLAHWKARAEKAEAWLNEALEGWEDGSNYKGEYLKAKHGDAEDIARIRAALKEQG